MHAAEEMFFVLIVYLMDLPDGYYSEESEHICTQDLFKPHVPPHKN